MQFPVQPKMNFTCPVPPLRMLFPSSPTIFFLSAAIFRRHYCSKPKLPTLSNVPSKYRRRAFEQAKVAITDYLHTTRALPFAHADHIVKNSQFSVSQIISQLEFSAPTFPQTIRKFLRYQPINEFEFFFESIGIDYERINIGLMKRDGFFLSEDPGILDVAFLLYGFGFPWNRLGILYRDDVSVFSKPTEFLRSRLQNLKEFGFETLSVVGICLAFPRLLAGDDEIDVQFIRDLKRVFVDYGLESLVKGNVDVCYAVCRKIQFFYNLGVDKDKAGEMMGKCKNIFIEYPENVFVEKAGFFLRMGIPKADVGLLLLSKPETLSYDLETPIISVMGILEHFGAQEDQLKLVKQMYPYVLGRNEMGHLPHALRAMDLHEWFFQKVKNGHHLLLNSYALKGPDEVTDVDYLKVLKKIRKNRMHVYQMRKLNFVHGLGFAENGYAAKIVYRTRGASDELQERFDCLLALGFGYSELCKMLCQQPKILNQDTKNFKEKVDFLHKEIGFPLEYLVSFPDYFCYDLEGRIKPRYRFHSWLEEQGLCTRKYSLGTIIATSEKNFVSRLGLIHPTAPKLWYEYISRVNGENIARETE